MRILVFTPSYEKTLPFIAEAALSIVRCARHLVGWESAFWSIVVPNAEQKDAHLRVLRDIPLGAISFHISILDSTAIGSLKRYAAMAGMDMSGFAVEDTWLVELDADDRLTENVFIELREHDPHNIAMVYGDCARFNDPSNEEPLLPFQSAMGWQGIRGRSEIDGRETVTHKQWGITPASLASILFSPDHLRVYSARAYLAVGGHDASLAVCDDHDLTQRLYLANMGALVQFAPAASSYATATYEYRLHGDQTTAQGVERIQAISRRLWFQRARAIGVAWAESHGLGVVELGCGRAPQVNGSTRYDMRDCGPGVTSVDLSSAGIPEKAHSAGYVEAMHVLEHIQDPVPLMAEVWRILVHGGLFLLEVPDARDWGAFADPSHRSFWVEQTFDYYTNRYMAHYLSGTEEGFARTFYGHWARFQLVSLDRYKLTTNVRNGNRECDVLRVALVADKNGERLPGANYWR